MKRVCRTCKKEYEGTKWTNRVYCSVECHKHKYLVAPELFWAKVNKNANNGCWEWTGYKDRHGYGDLSYMGRHLQAHRIAWMLLKGDPGTMHCLHKCNNPPCCNVDHLYLGMHAENTRDRVEALRHAWGERSCTARLKNEDVWAIRALQGKERAKDIAARYKVSPNHISNIWARRVWGLLK